MAVTKETALQVTIALFCIDSLWHQFKAYLTHTDWLHFKSRTIFPYSGQIAVSPPPLHGSMDKDEQTTAQGPATDRLSGNVTHVHIKASWPDIWVLRRTLKSFIKNVLTFYLKRQGVLVQMPRRFYKHESVCQMKHSPLSRGKTDHFSPIGNPG